VYTCDATYDLYIVVALSRPQTVIRNRRFSIPKLFSPRLVGTLD
jgi:hypothetical protein